MKNPPKEVAEKRLEIFSQTARETVTQNLESDSSCPSTIFHYTNCVGLRGILSSGQLWMTDMFALNDPSELHYGYSEAIERLRSSVGETDNAAGRYRQEFASQLENKTREKLKKSGHYFCCSFSRNGDDLGQWRMYADDGKGFALGFDCSTLERSHTKTPGFAAFPVIYDPQFLHANQNAVVEKFIPLLQEIDFSKHENCGNDVWLKDHWKELQKAFALPVLRIALHFKHAAYESEQEYRFLVIKSPSDTNGIKRRARNGELIDYIEYDWRNPAMNALKEIVIGPSAEKERASRFVQECLTELGMTGVTIRYSEIPYKSLVEGSKGINVV